MLIEFSVTNFQSFKERQTFSTLASKDSLLNATNLFEVNGKNYSKINVFYGANASGKTAFFRAFQFVRAFVSMSNQMLDKTLIPLTPFCFDDASLKRPSVFELVFFKDKIKYSYSFSCDRKVVYTERLDIYENGKPKLVFDRNNINQYKINSYHELEAIKDKNTNNKLFLCTAATWNFDLVKPVVDFILQDLRFRFNVSYEDSGEVEMIPFIEHLQEEGLFDEYKKFCLKLLSIGDFSIADFDAKIENTDIESFPEEIRGFFNAVKQLPLPPEATTDVLKNLRLITIHSVVGEDGKIINKRLNFESESLGTKALFKMAPVLFDVLRQGKILVVDELDRSLHPLLAKYIVSLFVSETNTNNAQLIFNTHDTNLLDLDILRRDEIWFVERDSKTGVSVIYPLTDFSPRNNENIEKGYLLGRYGAIPFIRNGGNLWEE